MEAGTPFSGSINIQLSRRFREHTWPHPQPSLSRHIPSWGSTVLCDGSAEERGPLADHREPVRPVASMQSHHGDTYDGAASWSTPSWADREGKNWLLLGVGHGHLGWTLVDLLPIPRSEGRRGSPRGSRQSWQGTGLAPCFSPTSYTTWSTRARTQLQVQDSVGTLAWAPSSTHDCRTTVCRALLAIGSMWV